MNDRLFDLAGVKTELPMTRKRVLCLLAAGLALAGSVLLAPLIGLQSAQAGLALGLVLAVVILWSTNEFGLIIPTLILVCVAVLSGLCSWGDVGSAFGNSMFLTMFGFFVVALGAEKTNIARRFALILLSRFGKKPTMILLALFTATAIVSAFVSNLATSVVMASVGIGILRALKQEPGESRFGRAMMVGIPVMSMVGGMALINGSAALNSICVSSVNLSLAGLGISKEITYNSWALYGVPCALVTIVPIWFILIKGFGVNNKMLGEMDLEYYKAQLREMGPVAGSEIRWLLTVVLMVISLLAGWMSTAVAALTFALITLLPVVGTVSVKDAMSHTPVEMLVMTGLCPLLATLFSNYEIGTWIADTFLGGMSGMSPLVFMIVSSLVMAVLANVFVNATTGILAVVLVAFTPLACSMGMDASIVLLPASFLGSFVCVLGSQVPMLMTFDWGYWKINETTKVGSVVALFASVVVPVVCYLVAMVTGQSLYL